MTRYDPFSYGNVKLGKQGGDAKPAASPEDVLFADAGPVKQVAPANDDSWSLLDEDVGSLLPGGKKAAPAPSSGMDFGSEILGEAPARAPAHKPATRAPAVAQPRGAEPALQMPASPRTASAPAARSAAAAAAAAPAPAAAAKPARIEAKAPYRVPTRRSRPVAAMVVPLVLCASGGTVASWMLVMQQNPVMAGLVAATTVVSAAFAWLQLRG
ncbi:MAG: hypothetical protein ACK501_15940 [Planctomycetota bacterium]|jgi:hypothetical protein